MSELSTMAHGFDNHGVMSIGFVTLGTGEFEFDFADVWSLPP